MPIYGLGTGKTIENETQWMVRIEDRGTIS